VDNPSDFLETTRDEMAGNANNNFISFDFQKTFHSTDVSAPSAVFTFGWAFVCFVSARLAVHCFVVQSVLGSLTSKPKRQQAWPSLESDFVRI